MDYNEILKFNVCTTDYFIIDEDDILPKYLHVPITDTTYKKYLNTKHSWRVTHLYDYLVRLALKKGINDLRHSIFKEFDTYTGRKKVGFPPSFKIFNSIKLDWNKVQCIKLDNNFDHNRIFYQTNKKAKSYSRLFRFAKRDILIKIIDLLLTKDIKELTKNKSCKNTAINRLIIGDTKGFLNQFTDKYRKPKTRYIDNQPIYLIYDDSAQVTFDDLLFISIQKKNKEAFRFLINTYANQTLFDGDGDEYFIMPYKSLLYSFLTEDLKFVKILLKAVDYGSKYYMYDKVIKNALVLLVYLDRMDIAKLILESPNFTLKIWTDDVVPNKILNNNYIIDHILENIPDETQYLYENYINQGIKTKLAEKVIQKYFEGPCPISKRKMSPSCPKPDILSYSSRNNDVHDCCRIPTKKDLKGMYKGNNYLEYYSNRQDYLNEYYKHVICPKSLRPNDDGKCPDKYNVPFSVDFDDIDDCCRKYNKIEKKLKNKVLDVREVIKKQKIEMITKYANAFKKYKKPKSETIKDILLPSYKFTKDQQKSLFELYFYMNSLLFEINNSKSYKRWDYVILTYIYDKYCIYQTRIMKRKNIIKCSKRFIITPITLSFKNSFHRVMLIYDTHLREGEIYNPHGSKTKFSAKHIVALAKKKFPLAKKIIDINDFMPSKGPQKYWDIGAGLCTAHSLQYVLLRLNNPDINRLNILAFIIDKGVTGIEQSLIRLISESLVILRSLMDSSEKEVLTRLDVSMNELGLPIKKSLDKSINVKIVGGSSSFWWK